MSPTAPAGGTGPRVTPVGRLKRIVEGGVTVLAGSTSDTAGVAGDDSIVSVTLVDALQIRAGLRCLVLGAPALEQGILASLAAREALVDVIHPVLELVQSVRARAGDHPALSFFSGVLEDVPARPAYDLIIADATPASPERPTALSALLRRGGVIALAVENPLAVTTLARIALDAPALPTSLTRPAIERRLDAAGLQSQTLSVFRSSRGLVTCDDTAIRAGERSDLLIDLVESEAATATETVEPSLWRSLVESGSSGDFADAFVVLFGGEGASPIWPSGLVAIDDEGTRLCLVDGRIVEQPAAKPRRQDLSFLAAYRSASALRRRKLLFEWMLAVEGAADVSGVSSQLLPDRLGFDGETFAVPPLGPLAQYHSIDFVIRFGLLELAHARYREPSAIRHEALALAEALGVSEEGWIPATVAGASRPVPAWALALVEEVPHAGSAVTDVSSAPSEQLIGAVSVLAQELSSLREQRERDLQRVERLNLLLADSRTEASRLAVEFDISQRANHENHLRLVALSSSRGYRAVERGRALVNRMAPWGTHRRGLVERSLSLAVRATRASRRTSAVVPRVIRVPESDAPAVSVVVPIHGKWAYTARCLDSLSREHDGRELEVIVVDDASPDDSRVRLSTIAGVRVIALDENVGFTRAANAGIAAARAPFVVMLNNDAEVTTGWLAALLDAAGPGVGIVGAKLVYPDGRLQEAGGIVFSDGTGWNYGKFGDPEAPEFNFRRRVDYCSGAAILLTPELLAVQAGFDERYAPAYYEDTDLAFAARAAGLDVVYEPRSVVIHHEGISNGTDLMTNTKRYQEINRAKFVDKWATEVGEQYEPDPVNVPLASQRRNGRGTVVVIDHMVPTWNEDAGSLRMKGILSGLVELGYDVVLIPDNRFPIQPYTSELRRMGVAVWTGWDDIWSRLRAIAPEITTVILSRASVAVSFIRNVREVLPGVPVLFDTVDLHFLREQRRSELEGGTRDRGVVATRELELAMVRSSEVTAVVSAVEQELLSRLVPETPVVLLPIVHEAAGPERVDRAGRSEITFVGSFAHDPNIDAVDWLVREIFPRVRRALPDARLVVVGKNPPSALIEVAPEGVEFAGWVEDLEAVHRRSLVSVAPLRYGAGVKGKVGDAWAHGVPTVMTSLASEGMSVEDGVTGLLADDAATFAAAIVRLVENERLWLAVSAAARAHVSELFGTARSRQLLEEALESTRRRGRA